MRWDVSHRLMASLPFLRRMSPYSSWAPSKFIWNRAIALSCDVNAPELFKYTGDVTPFHSGAYRKIDPGDTVCVTMSTLAAFCEEIFPGTER